jgi:two-component sensor histidine kinase
VTSSEGKVSRWIGTCTEIHDQKIAEDRLEQQVRSRTMDLEMSLIEKETLLKEVHHRVKNNLQVISSLLNLQISSLSDANAISALRVSQRRVLAMAMIHDRLSKGSQPGYVNFGEYSGDLVRELVSLYGRSGIECNLPTTTVILTIEQAVPSGMILSELVANALKYAYPGRTDGTITIELNEDAHGIVSLAVSDLGAGLPEGFDWRVTRSLGLAIVQILTKQIGGTLSVCSGVGVRFSVAFPRDTKGLVSEGKSRAATPV